VSFLRFDVRTKKYAHHQTEQGLKISHAYNWLGNWLYDDDAERLFNHLTTKQIIAIKQRLINDRLKGLLLVVSGYANVALTLSTLRHTIGFFSLCVSVPKK